MPATPAIRVGNATIYEVGARIDVNGLPIRGPRCGNSARRFRVQIDGGWSLIVDDIEWDAGPGVRRDVRTQGTIDRPTETPNRGLKRLGVHPFGAGRGAMELKQCRQKVRNGAQTVGWSKATLGELAAGAGVECASRLLLQHGALEVGERGTLGWEGGRRNGYQCATFPLDAADVPIIAYTLCVILPVARRF